MKSLASRGAGIVVVGLVLASSACAYGLGTATEARPAHDPGAAVRLHVTNHSGGPMEVYAAGSGTLYRLGTVQPGLAGRFTVRPGMIVNGPVEFLARSGNGPQVRSGGILLAPGDVVDFELEAHPATSNATVRARPKFSRGD
jgi:hypothetical protein